MKMKKNPLMMASTQLSYINAYEPTMIAAEARIGYQDWPGMWMPWVPSYFLPSDLSMRSTWRLSGYFSAHSASIELTTGWTAKL